MAGHDGIGPTPEMAGILRSGSDLEGVGPDLRAGGPLDHDGVGPGRQLAPDAEVGADPEVVVFSHGLARGIEQDAVGIQRPRGGEGHRGRLREGDLINYIWLFDIWLLWYNFKSLPAIFFKQKLHWK